MRRIINDIFNLLRILVVRGDECGKICIKDVLYVVGSYLAFGMLISRANGIIDLSAVLQICLKRESCNYVTFYFPLREGGIS
jgi:hypothetical protein